MTLGWLILIIVIFFAVFALFSPTVGSTESEESEESEESRKRREHMEEIKTMFLSQNGDFPDLILTRAFTEGSKNNPWILSAEKATSGRIRTVFIGYKDMYVFDGIPHTNSSNSPEIWPTTHYFTPSTGRTTYRTYLQVHYANDLTYISIDDYYDVEKYTVLGWIAEDIREKYQVLHPEMKVNELSYSTWHCRSSVRYYYFTYEVPAIQLSSWK